VAGSGTFGATPLLPSRPADALRAGRYHHMPVLEGGNLDEHRGFIGVALPGGACGFSSFAIALESAFHGSHARFCWLSRRRG
jgi:para-nitrobenzyl esterase